MLHRLLPGIKELVFTLSLILFLGGISNAQVVTNTNSSGPGSLLQTVFDAASGSTVTFDVALDGASINGLGIPISKNLTIDASNLSNGISLVGFGNGPVFTVNSGTVTFINLTFRNPSVSSTFQVGGVSNFSNVIIENCYFTEIGTGDGPSLAAGVYSEDGASLDIINSTFGSIRGNTAIWNEGSMSLLNVTFFDIDTGGDGIQVIYNETTGDVVANHITVYDNFGAGIRNEAPATNFVLNHSLIDENFDLGGEALLYGSFVGDNNALGDNNNVDVSGTGNFIASNGNDDFFISTLADNGGPVPTCAIGSSSPAVNLASSSSQTTDARGRFQNGVKDAGAFEFNGLDAPFITTWSTTDGTITIPTNGGGYNYSISWTNLTNTGVGDGSDSGITGNYTISGLANGDIYQVAISGDFPRISFSGPPEANKILTIESWGAIEWGSMNSAFNGCSNLTYNASDAPDLSSVTNTALMFSGATSFNGDLSSWDVSNITDMGSMFFGATSFNGDISIWNVSNVTNMGAMFFGAIAFNSDISSWNVSNVSDMSVMFLGADSFNGDISGWNVSNVTNMDGMFSETDVFSADLSSWNVENVENMNTMFRDAAAFNSDISGWNVGSVETMNSMFRFATSFNQDLSGWDVSNVTSMSFMFDGASNFDANLGAWDIGGLGSVDNMNNMLDNTAISISNYEATLIGWADDNGGTETIPTSITLGASGLEYSCAAQAARNTLTSTFGWSITGDTFIPCNPFTTTWQTTDGTITIPTTGGGYNYNIAWTNLTNAGVGDGSDSGITGNYTISGLANGDTYQIEILGDFPRIFFNNGAEREKILTIEQWGEIVWQSMERAFSGCNNLTYPATDVPDLSSVSNTEQMFFAASSFNGDLNTWDVSNVNNMRSMFSAAGVFDSDLNNWNVSSVENMSGMFDGAVSFNGNIGSWEVSSVENMSFMFGDALLFNSDISNWDVSSVENMNSMFSGAQDFNQNIGSWDVSSVTDMGNMFVGATSFNNGEVGNTASNPLSWTAGTGTQNVTDMSFMFDGASAFNQDISIWNTSNVTTMRAMFALATNFNQDLSSWNTSSVTEMNGMFINAEAFNQDISGWSTGNVTTMQAMFNGALVFDQDISSWDVSSVTSFTSMFVNADAFNQPIGSWVTISATEMASMFLNNDGFNQDISGWDMDGVTNIFQMFSGASSFDQSLASWDVSTISNFQNALDNTNLSLANYEATLIGWASQTVQSSRQLGANGLEYSCAAEAARNTLTSTFGWTITGDTFIPCNPFTTIWETSDGTITIPTTGGGYNYAISWTNLTNTGVGDGSDAGITGDYTISGLANGDTYQIEISGDFPRIRFFGSTETDKIQSIEQWGEIAWQNMDGAFTGCENLIYNATDVPDLSNVTSVNQMFQGATLFNGDLNGWDVSNITNMRRMFTNAEAFNSDLNNWNVSNVTNMGTMFAGATSFNGDISTWNVSNVTDMGGMFARTDVFNADLSSWNVGGVTDMAFMFQEAIAFNGNISNWNVGNVVSSMTAMFQDATSFNSDISSWDVSSVTQMVDMFNGATSFNGDLSSWDISSVTNLRDMLNNSGLSTANYDALLNGWATLDAGETQIPTGVEFGAEGLTYTCVGQGGRNSLTSIPSFGWTIIGDTPLIDPAALPLASATEVCDNDSFDFSVGTGVQTGYTYRIYSGFVDLGNRGDELGVWVEGTPAIAITLTDGSNGIILGTNTLTIVAEDDGLTCETVLDNGLDIIVNSLPTASISGDATICEGDATDLVFNLTGSGPFNVTYNDGSTDINLTGVTDGQLESVSPTVTTTYTLVAVTDAISCSPSILSSSVTITVNPLPTAGISGGAVLCEGETTDLVFDLTGSGPFDVTYNDGTSDIDLTAINDGHIETVTPIASTTYSFVSVTDNNGCSPSLLSAVAIVDVNPLPTAAISGDVTICEGDATDLTFALTGAGPFDVTYNDGTADVLLSGIVDGHLETVTPASTTTYTLVSIEDANGCSDNSSGTVLVEVNPAPVVTLAPQGPFCTADGVVTLTATPAGGTWSGTGITDAINGTFDPIIATPGTYSITYSVTELGCTTDEIIDIEVFDTPDATIDPVGALCSLDDPVTLTSINGGGTWSGDGIIDAVNGVFDPEEVGEGTYTISYEIIAGSCNDQDDITITVNPSPVITLDPQGPFCTADVATDLVATPSGGIWSGVGIIDAVNGTFDPAVATPGTYDITYLVDQAGCTAEETIQVEVFDTPDASIDPAGPFCSDDSPINLVALNSGGTWDGPGIIDENAGTFDPSQANIGNNEVTYTLEIGSCSDEASITVVVNQTPEITIDEVGTVCNNGAPFSLTASPAGGNWDGLGVDASGNFDPSAVNQTSTTLTYEVNENGCVSTESITINLIGVPEAASTINGPEIVCPDEAVTFSVPPITDAEEYEWRTPTETITSADPGLIYLVEEAGEISVVGVNSCGSGTASSLTLSLADPVEASFEFNVADDNDLAYFFQDASRGNVTNWNWDFGDGNTSNEQNPSVTYAEQGEYLVSLTSSNGFCEDTFSETIVISTEINIRIGNVITPNGNGQNDFIYIENIERYPDHEVQLLNRWGKEIFTTESFSNSVDEMSSIPDLQSGNYVCRVTIRFAGEELTLQQVISVID